MSFLKNIKLLASDTILYGLSSVLAQFAGLFLVPFYTKELSPEEYAIVGLFAMVAAFFNPFIAFGLDSALFRYFAMAKSNYLKKRLFTTAFLVKIFLVIFFVLLLFPCYDLLNKYIFDQDISILMFHLFLGSLFFDNIFSLAYVSLRVDRKVKKIVVINLICLIVSLSISIWLVLIRKLGVEGVMISGLATSITKGFLYFLDVRSKLFLNMFGFKKLKLLLEYGMPLIPHKVISQALNLFVLFLINNKLGLTVAGLFIVSKKFGKPISFLVSMVQTAWSPYKFEIHKNEINPEKVFAKLISLYWTLLIILWLILSLISPLLFKLLIDERYWDGIDFIPVIILIPIFEAFKFTVVTGFELSKDQKQMSIATIYSSMAVIFFLLISFDYYQPYNFMTAQIVSYLFFGIYIYIEARKIMKIHYPFKYILSLFMVSSLILIVFYYKFNFQYLIILFSLIPLIIYKLISFLKIN